MDAREWFERQISDGGDDLPALYPRVSTDRYDDRDVDAHVQQYGKKLSKAVSKLRAFFSKHRISPVEEYGSNLDLYTSEGAFLKKLFYFIDTMRTQGRLPEWPGFTSFLDQLWLVYGPNVEAYWPDWNARRAAEVAKRRAEDAFLEKVDNEGAKARRIEPAPPRGPVDETHALEEDAIYALIARSLPLREALNMVRAMPTKRYYRQNMNNAIESILRRDFPHHVLAPTHDAALFDEVIAALMSKALPDGFDTLENRHVLEWLLRFDLQPEWTEAHVKLLLNAMAARKSDSVASYVRDKGLDNVLIFATLREILTMTAFPTRLLYAIKGFYMATALMSDKHSEQRSQWTCRALDGFVFFIRREKEGLAQLEYNEASLLGHANLTRLAHLLVTTNRQLRAVKENIPDKHSELTGNILARLFAIILESMDPALVGYVPVYSQYTMTDETTGHLTVFRIAIRPHHALSLNTQALRALNMATLGPTRVGMVRLEYDPAFHDPSDAMITTARLPASTKVVTIPDGSSTIDVPIENTHDLKEAVEFAKQFLDPYYH